MEGFTVVVAEDCLVGGEIGGVGRSVFHGGGGAANVTCINLKIDVDDRFDRGIWKLQSLKNG